MKKLYFSLYLLMTVSFVFGQGEFNLYNLNRSVPQAHQLNPAFRPDAKVVVGLPVLSSTHVSVDMDQLSFNKVFTETFEQTLTLDTENLSSILREKNNFSIQSDLQLFFLGLNLGNHFFSIAFNDRVNSMMVYSKDIADLALFGNGDERTFGRNLALENMMLKQNLYHEIALGFSTKIGEKLNVGARFKILSGVLNAQTEQVGGYIRTDADSIHITNSNFSFRNSGLNYITEELDILSMYRSTLPFVGGNDGFGMDFGVEYLINDRISVSGSLTDLGYINWKENTESYTFDHVNYSFKGFDVVDLLNNDGNNNDFVQNELDSLESLFKPENLENTVYRSSLTSNFYTGFDYKVGKNHHFGAQVYGKITEGNVTPELGVYYNLRLGRVFNAVVNTSFRNGKLHAAGVGASVDLGPFQVYGSTESVTSLINPHAASLLDARVGLNLKFGRRKKMKSKNVAEEKYEETIPETDELNNTSINSESTAISTQAAAVVAPMAATIITTPDTKIDEEMNEELLDNIEEKQSEILPLDEEPKVVVVHQGDHQDELDLGHYIVVGAFLSKDNAQQYSNRLKAKGYNNQFGFLTEKEFYYVTVYKNNGDIEFARKIRNEYRKKEDFLFPDTWLLSVVE